MSRNEKVSVVVLGAGENLKKTLITTILGKDLSKKRGQKKKKIYESDTYKFIFIPDLNTDCDIKKVFDENPNPDVSLLVVEDGLSVQEVWEQIEKLQTTTGKPTEDFTVLLPLNYEDTDSFPKSYTMEQFFSELRRLAEERYQPNKRPADHHESDMCPGMSQYLVASGGRHGGENSTEPNKSLKRKHSGAKLNLVLLGMAGTGKSASGNTILGRKQFDSKPASYKVTTECQEAETETGSTLVRVIDTPDIFDEIDEQIKKEHVRRCIDLCQNEPSVYLLVMHVSRFTDGERNILKKLEEAFGRNVREQTIILFTRGDDLRRENMSLDEFLHKCQPDLQGIVKRCGYRCVVFENGVSRPGQVENLMQTVKEMLPK
ncbi:GTPase IMAP family member 3-like isoform X2 [Pempheris klunzingeri]|uniref:GTPase IMAP family member 3-like isoform X2 n=1 Tax=Pempheris klunzingeri TaxID=3127111 RepID=UPI00397FA8BB